MKVRLIGVGSVGESIVTACVKHFKDRRIQSLLESHRVIHATSPTYLKIVADLQGKLGPKTDKMGKPLVTHLLSPQEEMWLRGGLCYLFFQSPLTQFDQRLEILQGKKPLPDGLGRRADLRFWRQQLWPRVAGDSELAGSCNTSLAEAKKEHLTSIAGQAALLGSDWLVAPALPLESSDMPRRQNIGRKLIHAVLQTGAAELLVSGLGKKWPEGPEVDVVALAFSAGDSFGVEGSELLAEKIREALKDPDATRVIAILGFAVYENGPKSTDGRCIGRYLGLQHRRGMLDALIARPEIGSKTSLNEGLGFPQMLASIALASDPHLIQADNPDANQLQRDFGRRLFAAGFAAASQVPPIQGGPHAGEPMNLAGLYDLAKKELDDWHCFDGEIKALSRLRKAAVGLKSRYTKWTPPVWLQRLYPELEPPPQAPKAAAPPSAGKAAPPRIEYLTARKVIVYIGHNGRLNASELPGLRRLLARDFPRARTVVYKYSIDFKDQLGKLPPEADVIDSNEIEVIGEPPMAEPVAVGPEAHFALFVVDAFQTRAFERLEKFVLNNVNVRPTSTSRPYDPSKDRADIDELVEVLMARSLLSRPFDPKLTDKQQWDPPGLVKDQESALRTCVKDSVLGGVDEDFSAVMKEGIQAFVEGELIDDLKLAGEAQRTEMTIREAASSLIDEALLVRLSNEELADILCGLNVICNESLEHRKVKQELVGCLDAVLSDGTARVPIPD